MDEWMLPIIDLSRCTSCGLCVKHCPTHAVAMVEGQAQIVHPHACTYCAMCEDFCPVGAISLIYEIVPPTYSE